MANVRIVLGEALNHGAIVCPPDEDRSIRRLGKRTSQDQVPASVCLAGERQMRLPQCGATSQVVVNQ